MSIYSKIHIILLFAVGTKNVLFAQQLNTKTDESQLKIYPVLWQQTSAEYRALCYQAFNMATLQINEIPKKVIKKEKLAIITDLDETILDNSYIGAQLIKENKQMNEVEWNRWVQASKATAVPGAVSFLKEVAKKGITIFYVSNRDTSSVKSTLVDLQNLGLPNADAAHCIFRSNTSSKEVRRNTIAQNYKIVLLVGDNLNDFSAVFEQKSIADRLAETDSVQEEWGKKYIVLPNAVYGEWENALYEYEKKTDAEKDIIRKILLKGY